MNRRDFLKVLGISSIALPTINLANYSFLKQLPTSSIDTFNKKDILLTLNLDGCAIAASPTFSLTMTSKNVQKDESLRLEYLDYQEPRSWVATCKKLFTVFDLGDQILSSVTSKTTLDILIFLEENFLLTGKAAMSQLHKSAFKTKQYNGYVYSCLLTGIGFLTPCARGTL